MKTFELQKTFDFDIEHSFRNRDELNVTFKLGFSFLILTQKFAIKNEIKFTSPCATASPGMNWNNIWDVVFEEFWYFFHSRVLEKCCPNTTGSFCILGQFEASHARWCHQNHPYPIQFVDSNIWSSRPSTLQPIGSNFFWERSHPFATDKY